MKGHIAENKFAELDIPFMRIILNGKPYIDKYKHDLSYGQPVEYTMRKIYDITMRPHFKECVYCQVIEYISSPGPERKGSASGGFVKLADIFKTFSGKEVTEEEKEFDADALLSVISELSYEFDLIHNGKYPNDGLLRRLEFQILCILKPIEKIGLTSSTPAYFSDWIELTEFYHSTPADERGKLREEARVYCSNKYEKETKKKT